MQDKEMKTATGPQYGHSLNGMGINLLVRNIQRSCEFLKAIFEMQIVRSDESFAIVKYQNQYFMLHQDGTYADNKYLGMLPENGARGAGIEMRLYNSDPKLCEARTLKAAEIYNCSLLSPCEDKPHGLNECYILDEHGYCFIPSKPVGH